MGKWCNTWTFHPHLNSKGHWSKLVKPKLLQKLIFFFLSLMLLLLLLSSFSLITMSQSHFLLGHKIMIRHCFLLRRWFVKRYNMSIHKWVGKHLLIRPSELFHNHALYYSSDLSHAAPPQQLLLCWDFTTLLYALLSVQL